MITKIAIRNYRLFRTFDLVFSKRTTVLVGKNDSGKSTLVEAINLALTGRVNGRPFPFEFSPYYVNLDATKEYIERLREGGRPPPPTVIIDLFLEESEQTRILMGTNNVFGENACGVRVQAALSPEFQEEYESFLGDKDSIRMAPTEYYKVDWVGFSGNAVSSRRVPTAVSVIDPTTLRLKAGVDYHLQEIIKAHLNPSDRVELSRQYRSLREEFGEKAAVKTINEHLASHSEGLTDRKISLGIDISQRYTWEASLVAHLDDLPFQFIGKGDQCALKTMLAIGRRAEDAHVLLLEEPESHLSHTSLRKLVRRIEEKCREKQLIVATHSTYVLNKLGLNSLVLLGENTGVRIPELPKDTDLFFKKLAGFDTLRLVLAEGVVLVEGPSDELVFQRGYRDAKGHLPIEDGIDVISVGLSHKRFLDLAVRLKRRAWAITDNDGKTVQDVRDRFSDYLSYDFISLHVGSNPSLYTLELQIASVNELETLNKVFGSQYRTEDEVVQAMLSDKTGHALNIFESSTRIEMPEYLKDAIGV